MKPARPMSRRPRGATLMRGDALATARTGEQLTGRPTVPAGHGRGRAWRACRTIGRMTNPPRPCCCSTGARVPAVHRGATASQWILEERATRGEVVPVVRDIDVSADPDLEARYGALVPVVAMGDAELPLVTSARQLRAFLDATLPRLA